MIKWNLVFKRLMQLMDQPGPSYFSGPRFIREIQEFDPMLSDYPQYMDERKTLEKSTTRQYYFRDILMALPEATRLRAVSALLDILLDVEGNGVPVSEIRKLLGGGVPVPGARIPAEVWNADRLNDFLERIDGEIAASEYEHALTLCYTCYEGFLGAFVRTKDKRESYPHEIVALAHEVKGCLKRTIKEYPAEVLNGITNAAHAIDRARNQFSESHFGNEAGAWLATYVRDVLNTHIRLLLHFM